MQKKLDHSNFVEELKKFKNTKINFLPIEHTNTRFVINFPWTNPNGITEEQKKLQEFLSLRSLTFKKNESEYYITGANTIIGVNSDFIIIVHESSSLSVLTTKSDYLYSLSYRQHFDFSLNAKTFDFRYNDNNRTNDRNELTLLFNFDDYNKHMKNIEFSLKKNNSIFIISNMGLTSIKFNDSDIVTTFKGTSYSNMVLDYDFNIKSVEINNKLKKTLEIDNMLPYTDIKGYSDLMSKIKESLKDKIDFLSLTKDLTLKFKGSEKEFERDLEFIKKITQNKERLFNVFSSDKEELLEVYNHYKNYDVFKYFETKETTLEYRITTLKEKLKLSEYEVDYDNYIEKHLLDKHLNILALFTINEENNNNFMNSEILNKYKKLNNEIKDVLSFNNEILSFIKPLRKMR